MTKDHAQPFGHCTVEGCHLGAMKGMTTCGFHSSRTLEQAGKFAPKSELYEPPVPNALEMTNRGRLHGTYAAFRAEGWTDEQLIQHGYAFSPEVLNSVVAQVKAVHAIKFKLDIESWLMDVRNAGYVVRIEQVPCEPLAMGNHRDAVTVYEVRK